MSLSFVKRELYGGAITVDLPTDIVDASDLRQIPDHQEVFLRTGTLTSIIFEINEYQVSPTSQDPASALGHTTTLVNSDGLMNGNIGPSQDIAAATYHFTDVIAQSDHLSSAGVETTPVKLPQASMTNFPAYRSLGTIIATELVRVPPVNGQSGGPEQREHDEKCQQLLVRLKEYGTDLLVRVNVPLKEFTGAQSEAALTELAMADQIMGKIIDSLDVKEFSLFGGGE